MGGRVLALVVLFATVALGQQAKEPPATVADVEKAIRKRVDSWVKDRTPEKLVCQSCRGQWVQCADCKNTRANLKRFDTAFWRYLRPSFRQGKRQAQWLEQHLQKEPGREAQWRGGPVAVEQGSSVDVWVARDVVWVDVGRLGSEAWVWEDGLFYIDPENRHGAQTVQHPWFAPATLSVSALGIEASAQRTREDDPATTEVERERLKTERAKAEGETRAKVVADLGRLTEASRSGDNTYRVAVEVGPTLVTLSVGERPGETADDLNKRIASMQRGTLVVFRGTPGAWSGSISQDMWQNMPAPNVPRVLDRLLVVKADLELP